jgi:CubicO group peptidase (beta-lactamase class C family)
VLAELPEDGPGCGAALYDDDAIVWSGARGLADLGRGVAIDENTIFDIGSTSKQFTATAILLLAQEGRMDLDASLADFLPELPEWASSVTVRHLLRHTSGIPDLVNLIFRDLDEPVSNGEALDVLADVGRLQFEPGKHFKYSNSGYFLLARIVEAVDGRTLPDFLADEVFLVADISAVMDPVPGMPRHAKAYEGTFDGLEVVEAQWEPAAGPGAVQTTASELAKWGSQYWKPSVGGGSLLAARTADAVEVEPGYAYGAGIIINTTAGDTKLQHDGSWAGYRSELIILPDAHLAAAVTCNVGAYDPTELADELLEAYTEQQ